MFKRKGVPELLTFSLSFLILFYFFHEVILHPNDYLFSPEGDGVKNYYSYLFHARHDPGFWELKGMNYPFYEHIVYTDAQPLMSWLIGKLGLVNYGIGILNLLMLLSYPIASVFLFLILRHYQVSLLWAILGAVTITYLTPQMGRLNGHFSLAYVFAIPAMWWLLIKCKNGSATLWSIISSIYVIIFFFVHPYMGAVLCFFCLAFWAIVYLYNRQLWKTSLGYISLQVILPFVLFRLIIFATDTHIGRMEVPSGFYSSYGGWTAILCPKYGPMSEVTSLLGLRDRSWETLSYVGFFTIISGIVAAVYAFVQRKALSFKLLLKHELTLFIIASYLILLFSFCFPFKYDSFRWITDAIEPLKQFRALGRFSWVFFYVVTVSSIVILYHIYKRQDKKEVYAVFFFMGMAFNLIESYELSSLTSSEISAHHNSFKKEHLTQAQQETAHFLESGNYDAFIMLPFTHLSSENMLIWGDDQASFDAFVLSYHTGIPMLNSSTSRMSQKEAILFNNFFGPEFTEKELVGYFPQDSKIALITNGCLLTLDELKMTYTQKVIFESDSFTGYEFNRESWNTDFYFMEMLEKREEANNDVGDGWKSSSVNADFIYESWDDQKSESLRGQGSLVGTKVGYDEVYKISATSLEKGDYVLSFWYNHNVDRADMLTFIESHYKDKKADWADSFEIRQSRHIVGHWMMVDMEFSVTEDLDYISLIMQGNNTGEPYIIDELLIRKKGGTPLFGEGKIGGDDYVIYNNYWIKKSSFSK